MIQVKADSTEESKSIKRAALLVATMASFIGPFMGSSVNVALPSIGDYFSLSAVSLGWINTAYLLSAATFSIPFGRLGDIYGRKKIYMAGVFVFTIASIIVAMSVSGLMLILGRFLQGFGASMIFATGMALLMSIFPASERGKVLGITVASVYFGLSSGPFIGGMITQHLGWRYIFWVNVPLGLILLAVIFLMLKGDWAEERGQKFDLLGSLMLAVSLLVTMYGFSKLPETYAFGLVALGLIGIAGFVFYEMKLESPVVDMSLFISNSAFTFSNLAALINYAATFAVTFLLSLYLQNVKGYQPQEAGTILMAQPVVQAIFSPLAGRLSDRIQPRKVASVGMAFTLLGLVALVFIRIDTPLYLIIGVLMFLGFGFALFSSPNTNAIMSSVERRYYGVASAMTGTMRQIGMMVSMGIVMMIMALILGQGEIKAESLPQFISSMKISLIIFAVMCLGGIFASLARGDIKRVK